MLRDARVLKPLKELPAGLGDFCRLAHLATRSVGAIPRDTTAGTSEAPGPAPRMRGFRCGWPYPASLAPGTYAVKVGVFSGDWTTLYAWENQAATFAVE